VVVLVGIGFLVASWVQGADWQERGQRGDQFGGHLSAAGSIAGAILLFVAILLQRDSIREQAKAVNMQREELELQREELAATRKEMEQARQVHEGQREALVRQVMVASEAATISQIIEALKFRNDLDIRIQHMMDRSTSADESRAHNQEILRLKTQRESIGKYMDILTCRASVNGLVRPYLRELAGLPAIPADAGTNER